MDIRELRIGDKVTYVGRIVTIRAIYETGHVEFLMNDLDHLIEFTINCKDVEPILLTDKLLKKIGFTPMGDSRFALTDAALLKYDAINYMFITRYTHKLIEYLHQLQHELYDAGIELKIEL